MQITLSPTRGLPDAPETTISVAGDTLVVDDVTYDLSAVPEGGEGWPEGDEHPLVGAITRHDGILHLTVRIVYGADAARQQPTDPASWIVTETDGPVTIPIIRHMQEETR